MYYNRYKFFGHQLLLLNAFKYKNDLTDVQYEQLFRKKGYDFYFIIIIVSLCN